MWILLMFEIYQSFNVHAMSAMPIEGVFGVGLLIYGNVRLSQESNIHLMKTNETVCYLVSNESQVYSFLTVLENHLYLDSFMYSLADDCVTQNSVCIMNFSESLASCSNLSWGTYMIPVSFRAFPDLLNSLNQVRYLVSQWLDYTLVMDLITASLEDLLSDTQFSLVGLSCDAAFFEWSPSPNSTISDVAALLIIRSYQVMWRVAFCTGSVPSAAILISDFLTSFAPSFGCTQSQQVYISGVLTGLMDWSMNDFPVCPMVPPLPIPSEFAPFVSAALNATTGVIEIGPFQPSLLFNSSSLEPYACAQGTASPVTTQCEELQGVEGCDSNDACYIDWGPCESVQIGFYSPIGTLSEIPCPNILGVYETFVTSGGCGTQCVANAFKSNNTCIPVPIGSVLVACASADLVVECVTIPGSVFVQSNSCMYRTLVPAIGVLSNAGLPPMLIETWVNTNTLLLTDWSLLMPMFGSFPNWFLGLSGFNTTHFQLALFVSPGPILYSDFVPHINAWTHVAARIDYQNNVVFYLNAQRISGSSVVTSSAATITAAAFQSGFPALLNRMHFGPFVLSPADVVNDPDGLLTAYISSYSGVLPGLALFNARIGSNETTLGFFGASPPGFREDTIAFSNPGVRFDCRNFCLTNPYDCLPDCSDSLIYNPNTCECELRLTTTSSTSTASSSTSTNNQASTTEIVGSGSPTDVVIPTSVTVTMNPPSSTETVKPTSTSATSTANATSIITTVKPKTGCSNSVCETATDSAIGSAGYMALLIAVPLFGGLLWGVFKRRTQIIIPILDSQIHALELPGPVNDPMDPFADVTMYYSQY